MENNGTIKLKYGNSQFWTLFDNEGKILEPGQSGYNTSYNMMKIGDGVHKYSELEYLAASEYGEPVGTITAFAGINAPNNYLFCDGRTISKTNYPYLFNVIGYTYGGSGDNFNLPNLKGKVIVGLDSSDSDFNTINKTYGSKTIALTQSQMPSHNHTQAAHNHAIGSHTHTGPNHTHSIYFNTGSNSVSHTHTINLGSSTATVTNLVSPTGGNIYVLYDGSGGYSRPFKVINGNEAGIATTSQSHTHSVSGGTSAQSANHSHLVNGNTGSGGTGNTGGATPSCGNATPTINSSGENEAHNNVQPSLVLNYIIKVRPNTNLMYESIMGRSR